MAAMAALMVFASVRANSDVKKVSGSFAALKTAGSAQVVLDLSETQAVEYSMYNPFAKISYKVKNVIGSIDDRNAAEGADYVRDWPEVRRRMELTFQQTLDKKYKGAQLVAEGSASSYKIVFHVTHLDFGSRGAAIASGAVSVATGTGVFASGNLGSAILDGRIELQDLNGKVLGTIQINPMTAEGNIGETIRLCNLMKYTAKLAAKQMK